MGNLWKTLSVIPTRLRHKLYVAVGLMVLMPLAILCTLAAMVLPVTRDTMREMLGIAAQESATLWFGVPAQTWWVLLLVFSAMLTAMAGWLIIRGVIEPILQIASGARNMAEGELDHLVEIKSDDELGDISVALNQLTLRARKHMEELRQYSEQTKVINQEIHKRALAMAGLLQLGNLISQQADLDMILELALKQVSMVEEGSFAFLYLTRERYGGLELRASYNLNPDVLAGVTVKSALLTIDDRQRPDESQKELFERLGGANVAIYPVVIRGRDIGCLGVGNHAVGYAFASEFIELLSIFAKQIAIAVENDRLIHEAGELAIKDELTGLYNEHYIRTRLDEEIKRAIAYQRPCASVLFEIDNFQRYCELHGKSEAERMLKRLGWILLESVTEIDRVGRLGGNEFAVLLPERNKRQAIDLAEAIRKRVEFAFSGESDTTRRVTLSGGVSENPIDGVTAEELMTKARDAIGDAKVRGKNCVVA